MSSQEDSTTHLAPEQGTQKSILPSSGAPRPMEMMSPLELMVPLEQIVPFFEKLDEVKAKLLRPKIDAIKIQDKTFITRSGWRRLASMFRVSDSIVANQRENFPDGTFVWRFIVQATLPNGRSATATASCSSEEVFRKQAGLDKRPVNPTPDQQAYYAKADTALRERLDHLCYSIAHTRATNRAISNVIGMGEVSWEEFEALHHDDATASRESPMVVDNALTWQCPHCPVAIRQRDALETHMAKAHPGKGGEPVEIKSMLKRA